MDERLIFKSACEKWIQLYLFHSLTSKIDNLTPGNFKTLVGILFSFIIELSARKVKMFSATKCNYFQKFNKCAKFQVRRLA